MIAATEHLPDAEVAIVSARWAADRAGCVAEMIEARWPFSFGELRYFEIDWLEYCEHMFAETGVAPSDT